MKTISNIEASIERTRRTSLFLIAAAIALVGCGSGDDDGSETTAPAAESATTTATSEASPLEGTWRTEPVTIADMADTVREAGLGEEVGGFEQNAPISDAPTVLILEIGESTWDLYGQTQGGQREEIDFGAEFTVEANTVVVSHEGDANTYRWSVNEDVLSLTWLETTYGDYRGIPEEVFQRALYMTADFQRTS